MQSRTYKRVSWQLLRIVPYVIVISSLKIPLLGQSSFWFHGLNLSRNVLHDLFPFSLQSNIYSTKTLYLKKKNEFCILQKMLTNDWNNQTTSFFWILFFWFGLNAPRYEQLCVNFIRNQFQNTVHTNQNPSTIRWFPENVVE